MPDPLELSRADQTFLDRIYDLALAAEADGNLPIAALLARGSAVLAVGSNRILAPVFHPGRHAEVETFRATPEHAWASSSELTLYTSLEPCLMCFGTIVLHEVGRVVFGALDPQGGAVSMANHLPPYVRAKADAIRWLGPIQPERFEPLARRAIERSAQYRLPAGLV